jgi:hypothetical protein
MMSAGMMSAGMMSAGMMSAGMMSLWAICRTSTASSRSG